VPLWPQRRTATVFFTSQCSTVVCNTVVRATIKVNEKPLIWGTSSSLTPCTNLKFDKVIISAV